MPQRHLALETGGPPRLEVSWGADEGSFDVRLDGAPVGTLRGADELRNGKSIALPTGGEIYVRWEDSTRGPRVERDGTEIPEDERPRHLRSAIYCVYFVGGAHVLVSLADRILPGMAPWPHALQIAFGTAMLGLGALAQRGRHVALTIALALHIASIALALRSGAFPFIPIGLAFAMGWGVRAAKALDVPVRASTPSPYR